MYVTALRHTLMGAMGAVGVMLVVGAAPSGSLSASSASAGKAGCSSTCDECYSSGFVGAHLYLAPLLNDSRAPTFDCSQQDSCAFGAGCSYDAARATGEIEVALTNADWDRIESIAFFNPQVVPDRDRGVLDVMTCDGKTVLATIPITDELITAIEASDPVVGGMEMLSF